ncbi:hypothetical protein GRF63_08030 [Erythrobacter sp. GH3-10]|uniref:Uracil-DNA glycosylase-like domain-containing protein n=1 Tax=Aurantiacibacter rhizosphaerae TaxID=2691582 RepID=A0A844XDV3_9SPHN|nr:hypothetical protein [Aurantiacibacter rhizosphaerae]
MLTVKTNNSPIMEIRNDITLGQQYAATIDWWRDAGVDFVFTDEIEPLLADDTKPAPPPSVAKAQPEVEEQPEQKVDINDLPTTLADFRDWWVGPDNPFAHGQSHRLAPIGVEGAPIMVMSAMPEIDDRDTLLSGPQGRLLGNILRAIDVDPNTAYFASALPSHTTLPDWAELGRTGLGGVVAHHLALAKPQKILLFGSNLPTLLGHDASAPPESVSRIADIPTLATFSPDRLLDHARQRARLWKRLCQWTATL